MGKSSSLRSSVRRTAKTIGATRGGNLKLLLFLTLGGVATFTAVLGYCCCGFLGVPTAGDNSQQTATNVHPVNRPTNGPEFWNSVDDPSQDGWTTEVFHLAAKSQLKKLGKVLTGGEQIRLDLLEQLVAPGFACDSLKPETKVVFDDSSFLVERGLVDRSITKSATANGQLAHREAKGLLTSIRQGMKELEGARECRFQFKVFRVTPFADHVNTLLYFSIAGITDSGPIEQHATWSIDWETLPDPKSKPRILNLKVSSFQQARFERKDGFLFNDCTHSAIGHNSVFRSQFLLGMNHWYERIQDPSYFSLLSNPGLTIGDVNGDGLDDVYVCQEEGLPNRLFVHQQDGTATEQSAESGVDFLQSSRSALFLDLDNDLDQDLAVAVFGGIVIAENNGQGQFAIRTVLPTSDDTMSLTATDFDADGLVDLYACVYYTNQDLDDAQSTGALTGSSSGFVFHDANNGGANSLFRNLINGNEWQFQDVTQQVGLDVNNSRYSLAASWFDFDNDGDQDLYVANDFGRDNLYRNDRSDEGRRFVDLSDETKIENSASGMSVTCSDFDRDGWIDVFVSNMFSSAGNRIAYQQQFKPDASEEIRERYRRLARGNSLLRNQDGKCFDEISGLAGVEMGRWAWGSRFVDVNNDGWDDVVVSNGYLTTADSGDL